MNTIYEGREAQPLTDLEKETILYNRLCFGDLLDCTWTTDGQLLAAHYNKKSEKEYHIVDIQNLYAPRYLKLNPILKKLERRVGLNLIRWSPTTVARHPNTVKLLRAVFDLAVKHKNSYLIKQEVEWCKKWLQILEKHTAKIEEARAGHNGFDLTHLFAVMPDQPPDWCDHEMPAWVLEQIQADAKKLLEGKL
jgi:hypothetical protein